MKRHPEGPYVTSQVSAGLVSADLASRKAIESMGLDRQEDSLAQAFSEIDSVYRVLAEPHRILGSPQTKHGEVAEFVEVGIRRAQAVLEGMEPTTMLHPNRFGPTDYIVDEADVQSKFVNGVRNTLDHVIDHLHKYPNFGRGDSSYYHIPRDYHEIVECAVAGTPCAGFSDRSLAKIAEKAAEIQNLTGHPLDEILRPGVSTYSEVQLGNVHKILEHHHETIADRNTEIVRDIHESAAPTLEDSLEIGAAGAAVGGIARLGHAIWKKGRSGKSILRGDYEAKDWRDLGLEAGTGVTQGGISAVAIYGLTNYAELAAPLAGAFVSSAAAVTRLTKSYRSGEISLDELFELGLVACSEAAVVGVAAALGQALIPIPILGPAVGAVAGRLLIALSSSLTSLDTKALKTRLQNTIDEASQRLAQVHSEALKRLLDIYDELALLTARAFDPAVNTELRLAASVALAEKYGVPQEKILRGAPAVDNFMRD